LITTGQIQHTNIWLGRYRDTYLTGVPMRLHSRDLDADGKPQWSAQMRRAMTGTERRERIEDGEEEGQLRIRRAMQRLRKRSIREYEVLLRVMVQGENVYQVARWLNERAIKRGHPERYTGALVAVIVFAAIDKMNAWY
jgi:hypothetical protein